MNQNLRDVVIMAELDWSGLYAQSHVMAKGFAQLGHRVFYMNRTLQRWPRFRHLAARLFPKPSLGVVEAEKSMPDNITVINLWVGPPVRWMRMFNKRMIRRTMQSYDIRDPLFLSYVPTYNCIDLADYLNPVLKAYVCYHNFDADVVVRDLLLSEKEIINSYDLLFADSGFLMKRLERLSGGRKVYQSPPGVHFNLFRNAFRGDEFLRRKKICFYGGAGVHLDWKVYNRLCDDYEVIFIAVISKEAQELMDPRIKVLPPVPNHKLPELLRDMDILTILYLRSEYIDGVIPAKFFECIATGKPVLVSGLEEAKPYYDCVYDTVNSVEKTLEIIRNLDRTHDQQRINRQFEIGKMADFDNRFSYVKGLIDHKLNGKI